MNTPTSNQSPDDGTHDIEMVVDIEQAYEVERDRLVADLRLLNDTQWTADSLCEGWAVRDVATHLLMPYELGVPGLLGRLIKARFDFDRLADRWARTDTRNTNDIVNAIAATTAEGFGVPGASTAAPLCHLFIHAYDIRGPLGITCPPAPEAGHIVLDDLTNGKHAVSAELVRNLELVATDSNWRSGTGAQVSGPAQVLAAALFKRPLAAAQLTGPGATILRDRLTA